jgi:hypothetical protein
MAQTMKLLASMHAAAEKRMASQRDVTRTEHQDNVRLNMKINEDIRDAVVRLSNIEKKLHP